MKSSTSEQTKLYITPAHPCSYLASEEAQTLFVDPRKIISSQLYSGLTERGFRRSGSHIYKPHCANCNKCIPIRLNVSSFKANKTQRRVLKQNSDLECRIEKTAFTGASYTLFERYIEARHKDGDMYPATEDQFKSFLLSPWANTRSLNFYLDGDLVSSAVTDIQLRSISAIYTFFEPDHSDRSLGTLSILKQIQLASSMNLKHVYLGYWIRESAKMDYKKNYRPNEQLIDGYWSERRE